MSRKIFTLHWIVSLSVGVSMAVTAYASPVNNSVCGMLTKQNGEFSKFFIGDSLGNGMWKNVYNPVLKINEFEKTSIPKNVMDQLETTAAVFQKDMEDTCKKNTEESTFELLEDIRHGCYDKCNKTYSKHDDTEKCGQACTFYFVQLRSAASAFETGFSAGKSNGFDACESAAVSKARSVLPRNQLNTFTELLDAQKSEVTQKAK